MHLARLRLRDFRNYARLDLELGPGFHLLLGDNAQGKTNLLEAIYLLATLRSFRGVGGSQLVRHERRGYFLGAHVVGPQEHQIRLYWSAAERRLTLDHQPVRRWSDYLGCFRAVVFCTEDLQLVKGVARGRRRFLDLLLSHTQPRYLATLQRYTQALRARNALLRQGAPEATALEGFTRELVRLGEELMTQRRALLPQLAPLAQRAYARIAGEEDPLRLVYQPSVRADFQVELAQARAREATFRTTLVGPHRDELQLLLRDRPASQFGSEGQKRTLALALKLAQAEYLALVHGFAPVLLIDDVLGELDAKRRRGFLPLLDAARRTGGQVFVTCTAENWPRELAEAWRRWEVWRGTVRPWSPPP